MVSHVVDVMLHGVFASLTGGWFYNLHNDILINTLHMYLWIVLGLLPFIIYLTLSADQVVVYTLYTGLVTLLFVIVKGLNLYLHKVFKETDEISAKQEFEEELEEIATNTAKAPSSDSITMPQGSSNAIRGSLPDSIASNFFDRQSNSESQQEETATEKNADPAPDELLRDIIQNEHRIFRRPVYLFRHKSRPVRLVRVILKIVRTATGYKISCTTPNNTQIMCHLNVEQEVTIYKNSVTWTTQTDYFPCDRMRSEVWDDMNYPQIPTKNSGRFNNGAIYTAFFDTEEAAQDCFFELLSCRRSTVVPEETVTISDVVVHKHPDSPQVMGFENKKKSIEHTYATLEDADKVGNTDDDISSLEQSSRKEEPAYDVLYCWDQSGSKMDPEEDDSPRSASTRDTSVRDQSGREDTSQDKSAGRESSLDTISLGDDLDVPALLEDTKQDGELTLTKRKVCRTDGQTSAHVDFLAAFPSSERDVEGGSAAGPPSPRVLRQMKTIAVVPERGQLHHDHSEVKTNASLLRETRSFDTGTQESPVNVRLRRQSQLNTQRRSHESRSSATSRPSRFAPVHLQSTPEPSTATSSNSGAVAGTSGISRHIATDYTDTTPGAIHKYYDENGKEQIYMFELQASDGSPTTSATTADTIPAPGIPPQATPEFWANNQAASYYWQAEEDCFNFLCGGQASVPPSENVLPALEWDVLNLFQQAADNKAKTTSTQTPRKHYNVKIFWKTFTIHFDRLHLERLLDEDKYSWIAVLKICLAVLCSLVLILLLNSDIFHGIEVAWLCVVLAGCQFCLIKSVQPDSASPTQGFNHITPISRPIYFLLSAGILLGLNVARKNNLSCVEMYGWKLCSARSIGHGFAAVKTMIMFFPVIFLFGLFPQVNTFLLFVLEQIDIHVFGGNACHSVSGAVVSLTRSLTVVGLVYGFCYAALLEEVSHTTMWLPVMLALSLMSSYHLSRTSGNISTLFRLIKRTVIKMEMNYDEHDNLPLKMENILLNRYQCDLITCTIIGVLTFAVSASTAFVAVKPHLVLVMKIITIVVGVTIHYLIPHLRKSMPFLWFLTPCLKTKEHALFEVHSEARAMWYEKAYLWVKFVERNVLYPLLFLAAVNDSVPQIKENFGVTFGALIISVVGIKLFRQCYSYTTSQYKILLFTVLFFEFDYHGYSETFPIDYYLMSIVVGKIEDLVLKMEFLLTYIAPWQIVWGSAVHAFAQPFSIPHSGFLFLQTILSSVVCAPLSPFQGSALFIMGYVRPLKFWERDYNTRRNDSSNVRLAATLEHTFDTDQNNFNSIFYEHLSRSLQNSLCGDLMMGRWGNVTSGDCFIMASDYLNALVHIVEFGNGLVTFQLRGLEFKGTFCQMREVEAITEDDGDDKSCLCCEPGHAPGMLSVNAAFNRRWLAWEVMNTKYVLEGYSITKNSASTMLAMHALRKTLIKYFVQSLIFFTIKHSKFLEWIQMFLQTPQGMALSSDSAIERESMSFSTNIDVDYDIAKAGISRKRFRDEYIKWIKCCLAKREEVLPSKRPLSIHDTVTLCFGMSILGRRALASASPSKLPNTMGILCGIHALLKNDIRISNPKDEWVFQDMEILKEVLSPAIKMALKLFQDHFIDSDQFEDLSVLYESSTQALSDTVVAYEGDPLWRSSILNNANSLLTLRHVLDDTSDEYQVFTLNKRYLSFRIIKVNRECVRGLWAGQQQELIFLRNTNPERGSIQHAKQALRNMINSSCDDPIGYPIYVSPLITGYSDTHRQVASITGMVKHYMPCLSGARRFIHRILNCSGLEAANSIDADAGRQAVFYHPNRTVTLPCDNKPTTTRPPSGSFHSCLDFGSNDPVSQVFQESDTSPVHHRSSGQSENSKKGDTLGCVAASDPIISCVQGLSSRSRDQNRSTRQHRAFLSGRAESTSAADKSQEILPPPNLRQGPTCDNENLNKVPLSSRCLLSFDGRGKNKMSSSVSLPSNTSLQHSDLPKKTTSDNHLNLSERKISRELLTKATSDINFNPIIEVNMKSPATSDEDSEVESTPLLNCSHPKHPSKHQSSLSAPHLSSDKHSSSSSSSSSNHLSDKHRRVDFASTDIEIPDLDSSRESMRSRDRTKDSSVSLCMDILHSDSLRDGYSVDVGVQADRADSPCLTRFGSAPTIRHQSSRHRMSEETVKD